MVCQFLSVMSWLDLFLILQGDPDKGARPHLRRQLKPGQPAHVGLSGGAGPGASCRQLPPRFSGAVVSWLSLQRPTSRFNLLLGDT